ncbi:PCMTD2 [Symbiodinium sp. CCMP2592]|nr:PCMTD2 [Symbiodinium sp. CCMP2592]
MGDPHTAWLHFGRQRFEEMRGLNANNEAMVDELVDSHALRSTECIDAFKAIDRGHFWPAQGGDLAYADMPLRHGRLHLSAPHIYGKALESLMPLQPGMSFLNIGSGTGYFNSIVSEFTGPHAANHGVEIWPETVAHAKERAAALGKTTIQFTTGNVYQLNVNETMRYDRIYIGACANSRSKYLYRLLEVGGVLIGPFQVGHSQQLRRVVRQTETHFFVEVLGSVQFACLVEPMQCTSRSMASGAFAPPPRTGTHTEEFHNSAQSGTTTPATVSSGDATDGDNHQLVGLPGVPFTFSLLESPWTPERSWLYPASFKQAVATGLLCQPKHKGIVGLPAELWIKHIIPWCSRRWFEGQPSRNGTPAMQPAAHTEVPSALVLSKSCKDEEGSEDSASTRAPSSQSTPDRGPSHPPLDMWSLSNPEAVDEFGDDVLVEVWSNGQRHAIGVEGDPDDADHERDQRMAVPLRVLQLLAEEARTRQRRRQRESEEEIEEEEEENPQSAQAEDSAWNNGDEAWTWADDLEEMELELEGEPPGIVWLEQTSDMQDVEEMQEDVRMF